ncbi:hypothetical protein YC2023_015315 [Brassica napus]
MAQTECRVFAGFFTWPIRQSLEYTYTCIPHLRCIKALFPCWAYVVAQVVQFGEEITRATISSEHNDITRSESSKIDYIRMSNIIEISGERRIVTELGIELPTYPSRDQV